MRLQLIKTHYHIPFLSYPKISSKVRFMYATLNVAASHGEKYNQTFPVGQHNHRTTLRVESNQSRRRPTSWSFCQNSPTPVSMRSPCRKVELPPLAPLETTVPISQKFREKVESFFSPSLLFKSPFLFSVPSPSPIPLFGLRWVKGLSSILPHVHFSMALKISPYPLIPLPWISFQ